MFTRIRNAVRILSTEARNPYEEPDIIFEEENEVAEGSVVSGRIAGLFATLSVSFAVAVILTPLVTRLLPLKSADTTTVTAITASLLAIIIDHVRMNAITKLQEKFDMRQTMAPFFGRKINKTLRILRS